MAGHSDCQLEATKSGPWLFRRRSALLCYRLHEPGPAVHEQQHDEQLRWTLLPGPRRRRPSTPIRHPRLLWAGYAMPSMTGESAGSSVGLIAEDPGHICPLCDTRVRSLP
jgi:hypothetical protein